MILWLLACVDDVPTKDVCAGGHVADGRRTVSLRLEADAGVIDAQLRAPEGREAGELPVVVQVFGAWDDALEPETAALGPADAVSLRVALSGADWGDGTSDTRGPFARAAVAAALRFGAGLDRDVAGCSVEDRVPAADPSVLLALGLSNGGNLVLATLGDAALDVPEPVGVITWETPVGAQLVNIEHRNSPDLYTPGSCALGADGLGCPFGEPALLAEGEALCFDVDDDGACADGELAKVEAVDPATGRYATSPELLALARAAGAVPATWDDEGEADTFWDARDGSRLAGAAVARFPEAAWLLVASETDHVLTGLGDHPHVYGLGETLQGAGARWVRLNAGAPWSGLAWENAVDTPLSLAAPTARLLTDDEEGPLSATLDAAVAELTDRQRAGVWVTEW